MISAEAPARVGLLGNPSDGYGGRTLSLAVPRFKAVVTIESAAEIELVPNPGDLPRWSSLKAMVERVDRNGYGTGPQLLAATIRTFADVARSMDRTDLDGLGFRVRYRTSIPRQVGLGGSSALVVAMLRALGELTEIELPDHVLPSVALRVETEQLGIMAGLQDRVVQTMGGLVSMNFAEMTTDPRFGVSHGEYRSLDPSRLPPLFLAYRTGTAEPSGTYHGTLRRRFDSGDRVVSDGLRALAGLVVEGEAALRWSHAERLTGLIDENMNIRESLAPIPAGQLELVEQARSLGVAATFAGSGGAVVGVYEDDQQFDTLTGAMASIGADVVSIWPQTQD